MPRSVILDKNCERLAFPRWLNKSQFGYTTEPNILIIDYLITSRYFHRVSFVLQQLNLNSNVNIAMDKFSSSNVTTGMLSKDFKKT